MDLTKFAICILMPDASSADIPFAAKQSEVYVIGDEPFDVEKEYSTYFSDYILPPQLSEIHLLFLFPGSRYVLADTEDNLAMALEEIKKYKKEKTSV